ncbi:hypothetical protein Pmar_PMAR011797, partial [Perkinsus marinus ATCC 50983]
AWRTVRSIETPPIIAVVAPTPSSCYMSAVYSASPSLTWQVIISPRQSPFITYPLQGASDGVALVPYPTINGPTVERRWPVSTRASRHC